MSTKKTAGILADIMGDQNRLSTKYGEKSIMGVSAIIHSGLPVEEIADVLMNGKPRMNTLRGEKSAKGIVDMLNADREDNPDSYVPIVGVEASKKTADAGGPDDLSQDDPNAPAPAAPAATSAEFDEDGVKAQMAEALSVSAEDVEVEDGYADDTYKVTADGTEYEVMESEDAAEARALEQVKQDLENEPELFTKDWLKSYIKFSDTDCRLMAQDLVGDYYREMKDSEVKDEYERVIGSAESGLDDAAQAKADSLREAAEAAWKAYKENQDDSKDEELRDAWHDADALADEAEEAGGEIDYDRLREELEEKKSDEYESSLKSDPYAFLVEEQGYDDTAFFKQFGGSIDVDEAAQDAVSTDGWAHFLSRYDGNYDTTPAGFVYWRE